ncbi:MAG: glycosyltransferase [Candidatus Melainabacteria bacterium]|nr:glycosyltransferase [Candidatus Melainabacteria bacterium]
MSIIVVGVFVGLFLAVGALFLPQLNMQWLLAATNPVVGGSGADASIADVASSYYGSLTRPLIPASSLFLPLQIQAVISLLVVVLMLLTAVFMPRARTLVMLLTTFAIFRHIAWRAVETMQFTNIWVAIIGWTLLVMELMAAITLVLGYFQMFGQTHHKPRRLTQDLSKPLPSVDVMVCTYNEPVSVLYRTMVGCQSIDYPNKKVYLLDDGNRPEMKQLAEHLGVHYIARSNPEHAKAGNLNNALRYTNGELVLVFDADHVPCKKFLQEVVGFFDDSKMAFVQTPQHFFTIDPFQRNLVAEEIANNEQDLFFHVIQPGNDYWGCAFFAGSGAIFRRDALAEIGGFAVETITEDVHTGLRLHAKGWKSMFYNQDLAAGLAQDSFADFVKQRLRWARGMTQILFNDHPLLKWGLTIPQRICYFAGIWYFFSGIPRLFFLIMPLFFLLFGMMTINAGFAEIMVYYIPSFVCLFFGYTLITRGFRHTFWSEVYETALCFYMSVTAIGTIFSPRRSKFRVTPKGGVSDRLYFNWQSVTPQIVIAALTVLGIGMAIIRAIYTPEYVGGIFTNMFWSAYNLILLIGSIYVAQERPQYRLAPRIYKRIRCELRLLDGTIAVGYTTNISESGIALVFEEPIPVAGTMALKLLDWDINESTVLNVQAVRSSLDGENRHYIGFRIVNRTDLQHRKLVRHMFGTPGVWHHEDNHTNAPAAFLTLINTPFRLSGTVEQAFRRRTPRFQATLPCVVETGDQQYSGYSNEISETGMSVLLQNAGQFQMDQMVRLRIQWSNGAISMFNAVVKRAEGRGQGQVLLGVNFVKLGRAQRMEIIQQIYGPREGLIRVAPSAAKMVNLVVQRANGDRLRGISQEISEMGLRATLQDVAQMQPDEQVSVQLFWEDRTTSEFTGVVVALEESASRGYAQGPTLIVYFKDADLPKLDALSQRLHEPVLSEAI